MLRRQPWILEHVDARAGIEALGPAPGAHRLVQFWWDGVPVGRTVLAPGELVGSADGLAARFVERSALYAAALQAPGAALPPDAAGDAPEASSLALPPDPAAVFVEELRAPARAGTPSVSVVVATRGRGSQCRATLQLLGQQTKATEVLLVDNNDDPLDELVDAAAELPWVTYVRAPVKGLSRARNAGIAAASSDIVAFTDDDAVPQPDWTARIADIFSTHDIDALTGSVVTRTLDTPAVVAFEIEHRAFGGMGVPLVYDPAWFESVVAEGASVWRIGAGANMAFRRDVFDRVGGFDVRLGPGEAGCNDDSEMWYRLLAAGGTVRHDPAAVVAHDHRPTMAGLRSQMRLYMEGHAAALVAQYDRHGHPGNKRRITRQLPPYYWWRVRHAVRHPRSATAAVLPWELVGWLRGSAYLLDRRWRRRTADPATTRIAG